MPDSSLFQDKPTRLYRHIGGQPGKADSARSGTASRDAALADLCRQHALATHGPAMVLSNRKHECLYLLGPTERYLRMAPGHATLDVLTMVRESLQTTLRSAIQQATHGDVPIVVPGGCMIHDGQPLTVRIEVHPVRSGDEDLLLIYFIDEPGWRQEPPSQDSLGLLKTSSDEQKAINKTALSLNEELQSLNDELATLNSQLQGTLEQQRTTSNDLQNVLYSTDVATLFLDSQLNIRFFTPATRSLFNVIQGDIGRPLTDLNSLAADSALPADAAAVLQTLVPVEREVETPHGIWCRRIVPYRTHDGSVEGVVITFTDITKRKHAVHALEAAKQQAELASAAKSRFLASASHDLRQPMQTLALLQGLLARKVEDGGTQKLVARLDDTLGVMAGLLSTLLDINQIEAGAVHAELADFGINALLARLRDEFTHHAEQQGLSLRVVPCGLRVRSDPHLLEQMLRNLVSNAIKCTEQGKVLLGCRRLGDVLSIEVWNTGDAGHERDRGPSLGLSIVQRLGELLGHRVRVRPRRSLGAAFSIDVALPPGARRATTEQDVRLLAKPVEAAALTWAIQGLLPPHSQIQDAGIPAGTDPHVIFVVDDDRDVRASIRAVLENDGRIVEDHASSEAFLQAYQPGRGGCLLVDAYLPGIGGVELLQRLRAAGDRLPAIMITGNSDVPMAVQAMKAGASDFIEKPIGASDLLTSISRALEQSRDSSKLLAWREDAAQHIASLTPRQRQIMDLVLAGYPSKNIAADLGVSQRTVENHRASIMRKSGAKSLPALARLALAATG